MTCQSKKTPKADFHCRIANENYDYLYQVARANDSSLAKALDMILAELRQSGTTTCEVN